MIKRVNRIAMAAMRDVAVVWSSEFAGKKVMMHDIKRGIFIQPNDYHFHAVQKIQHRWSMTLIAVGIEPNGNKYIKTELHTLNDPRLHTATIEYFNEQHERLLGSINPNHGKQAAWIATIEEIDLTEDQILRITGL